MNNQVNENVKGLNELLTQAINDSVFCGCNWVVVTPNNTYMDSLGLKIETPSKEVNDLNTMYDMASCTKVICTTTCIMKLLEMGKLRLFDSVSMYVEGFPHKDILIWDLMTHTSGLPADVHRANKLKSKEELLEKIFNVELTYEKNTKIVYSDIGFMLLGMVVESISKMRLDEFAKINIFNPLKMTHTGFNHTDKQIDATKYAATEYRCDEVYNGILRGYVHDEKAYIMGGVSGHAGLFSTVEDISHFIKMILNDGVYEGVRILSKPTIDKLFEVCVAEPKGIAKCLNQRGLGWIVSGDFPACGDLCSPKTIHHTGFTGTNIFIDRINKIGFSLLTNRVHPTRNNTLLIPFRAKVGNFVVSHFPE